MTAIVAVKSVSGVYIGGDRAASNCWGNTEVVAHPKVFRNKHMLIGWAGDFRAAQILQYLFEPPKITKTQDAMVWCVSQLVPAVQECFEEHGYDCDEDDFALLFTVHERIFSMSGHYAVMEYDKNWACIGDGEQYCDGVLSVLGNEDPQNAIRMALSAAEKNCGTVLGPFDVIKA